jgi:hypothetical protein
MISCLNKLTLFGRGRKASGIPGSMEFTAGRDGIYTNHPSKLAYPVLKVNTPNRMSNTEDMDRTIVHFFGSLYIAREVVATYLLIQFTTV